MKYYKRFIKIILPVVWSVLLLTGCSFKNMGNDMRNVEERDYATILMVSEAEEKIFQYHLAVAQEKRTGENGQTEQVCSFEANSLEELARIYEMTKGKDLSLAHLKVILLEAAIVEEEMQLEDILQDFDNSFEVAKTCPVLQMEDTAAVIEHIENAKEPVGTYFQNLIQINERRGKEIPWLKDYLKVVREGDELYVYALKEERENWKLSCIRWIRDN